MAECDNCGNDSFKTIRTKTHRRFYCMKCNTFLVAKEVVTKFVNKFSPKKKNPRK